MLIPLIKFFGDGMPAPARARHDADRRDGRRTTIRGAYVLYIGAGAVAAGGIISLVRSLPIIWHGHPQGLSDVPRHARRRTGAVTRTAATDGSVDASSCGIGIDRARWRDHAGAARCT